MIHERRPASYPLLMSQGTLPILEVQSNPTHLLDMAASTNLPRDIHTEMSLTAQRRPALNIPSVPTIDLGTTPPCQPKDVGH